MGSEISRVDFVIHRGYFTFSGEYQIYFIECVENISNFTSA